MRPLNDAKARKEWVGALCKNRRSFQCNCVNQVTVFKYLVYSVNNTWRPLFYVIYLWVNLISLRPLNDANARKEWVGALCKNKRSFLCTIASENDLLILTAYCVNQVTVFKYVFGLLFKQHVLLPTFLRHISLSQPIKFKNLRGCQCKKRMGWSPVQK